MQLELRSHEFAVRRHLGVSTVPGVIDSETWHRLLRWNGAPAAAERLAAQVLLQDGWSNLDPSHPRGGPDGRRDAILYRDDRKWVMAVYFPHDVVTHRQLFDKFRGDAAGVGSNDAFGIVFVTNQPMTLGQRSSLQAEVGASVEIYHLERIVSILDRPEMAGVRHQYLGIGASWASLSPVSVFQIRGGSSQEWFRSRQSEVEEIGDFLGRDGPGVLSLHGMPGVGKSALAQVAMERWCLGAGSRLAIRVDLRGYASGELGSVTPTQYLAAVAEVIGADCSQSPDLATTLVRIARHLELLLESGCLITLLLDDVSSREQIAGVVEAFGCHKVIFTTRDTWPSQIPGSQALEVKPMDEESGRAVLIQSARRLAHSAPGLDNLVSMCGGLPVALGICGRILDADTGLTPDALAEELRSESDRLDGLSVEDSDLRAIFMASYKRIDENSQRVFMSCGIFPGSNMTAQAASVLTKQSVISAERSLRGLALKHLLDRSPDGKGWRVHDLLRLFAAERSIHENEPAAVIESLEALADHYATYADAFNSWMVTKEPSLQFSSIGAASAWIEVELLNALAVAQERSVRADYDRAWLLSVRLGIAAYTRLHPSTSLELAHRAVLCAKLLGDIEKEADALNNLGLVLSNLQQAQEAKGAFLQARRLFRQVGHLEGEARILPGLAEAMRKTGDDEATFGMLKRAVRISEQLGDEHGAAVALTNLGIALREGGRLNSAYSVLRLALSAHERTGFSEGIASSLGHLGLIRFAEGGYAEAVSLLEESIAAGEVVGHAVQVNFGRLNLGSVLMRMGRLQEAEDCLMSAYRGFSEVPHGDALSRVVANLRSLHSVSGSEVIERLLNAHRA